MVLRHQDFEVQLRLTGGLEVRQKGLQIIPVHQRKDPVSRNIITMISVNSTNIRGEQCCLHFGCHPRSLGRALGELQARAERMLVGEGC
jgi:hypothetical protein